MPSGLSLALGAFLAGMMLAETEYRHQIESVIRPFRDILLGLFFIAVGSLLDIALLGRAAPKVLALLVGLLLVKTLIVAVITRLTAGNWFRSLRTGIVIATGGEFGFALADPAASGRTRANRRRAAAARGNRAQHGGESAAHPPQQTDCAARAR